MADFPVERFESLVRDFLAGKKSWDAVHNFVIDAEWANAADIPASYPDVLRELQWAFLSDSEDDPQFVLSKAEIRELFDKLQRSYGRPS